MKSPKTLFGSLITNHSFSNINYQISLNKAFKFSRFVERLNMSDLKELRKKAEAALDLIRPYLQTDGGDVQIIELTDDLVLRLQLLGACGSCPMSLMTLKAGVEETVKREVPEIKAIEAINAEMILAEIKESL